MIVTDYNISNTYHLKIAVVSDLHERRADEIISLLKLMKPDLICCPGDLLERHDSGSDPRSPEDYSKIQYCVHAFIHFFNDLFFSIFNNEGNPCSENTYHFFEECKDIAPLIYSLGNHEYYISNQDKEVMKANDVIFLDNDYISIKGIHVGGLSPSVDLDFISKFESLSGFKLLLFHHPEFYSKYLLNRKIDLVISGHAHGGQIRLFNKGIFSPGQGLFPKLTKGIYKNMIISAGCSNTAAFPRINNPCEILCIHL